MKSNFWKRSTLVVVPVIWYGLGMFDRERVKVKMYGAGFDISQKFKQNIFWDNCVEPFLMRQFSVLFSAGYSLIEGMISDNEDQQIINKHLEDLKMQILKDMKFKIETYRMKNIVTVISDDVLVLKKE